MSEADTVTAREFLEHARITDGEIAAIRERQSKLEASLTHVPADVANLRQDLSGKLEKLTNEIAALRASAAPPQENFLLTITRLMDERDRRGRGGFSINTLFGLAGAAALAWLLRGIIGV